MARKKESESTKKLVEAKTVPEHFEKKSLAVQVKSATRVTHCLKPTIDYTFSDGSTGQICQVCKATLKEIYGVQQVVRSMGEGEFVVVPS